LREDCINFLEHCILVASRSPNAHDGPGIHQALEAVAAGFWPDLATGAVTSMDMETSELVVETPNAIYYVSVRAVVR
jgi:hypothetical protein